MFSLNSLAETPLTQLSISHMAKMMEEAAKEHDTEKLISHFTKDAQITLDMPANMGGKMVLGVNQYEKLLKQGWAMPAKFTYETKDLIITVASDGKSATATDLTIETIEINGKVIMSSKSREKITIISLNGIPKITTLYGKLEL